MPPPGWHERVGDVVARRPWLDASSLPHDTLGHRLTRLAESVRVAVIDGQERVTGAWLAAEAQRLANGLAADGVGPGDIVLAQVPNWWETVALLFAAFQRGAVVCPVVSSYRAHELRFILRQARPTVVFAPERYRGFDHLACLQELAAEANLDPTFVAVRGEPSGAVPFNRYGTEAVVAPSVEVAAKWPALLLYTSGTTADPKGALHTHQTVLHECRSIISLARLGDEDVVFMPSPLAHITGALYGAILPVDIGIPVVLLERWDAGVGVRLIEEHGCTFTVGATTFLSDLTQAYERAGTTSSLAVFICGGADIPPRLVERARASLDVRAVRTYGSTELPTATIGDPFGDPRLSAHTDGVPIEGIEVRLAEARAGVGELEIRGPELFAGYLDAALDETAFTPDGYFRSGDLASIDDRGAVTIRGRLKDTINRGGEKYSARDVEDVLIDHPSIAEVALVGVPDPRLVERACLFVVPVDGATLDLGEVRRYLLDHGLPIQKAPEHLRIVDALPRTASGKIQKFRLRESFDPAGG